MSMTIWPSQVPVGVAVQEAMAQMAGAGFGARVMVFDPGKPQEVFDKANVTRAKSLGHLLENADAVSLHTVLNESTRNMIGAAELARMKPGALLINVSRGTVIDETAMIEALQSGGLGWAGLDVFEAEPKVPQALRDLPNVVLLPHVGSATLETRAAMGALTVDNLLQHLNSGTVISPVPECADM